MENPTAYIPMDRRQALVRGTSLPERSTGAALFVDISGFTPLTEALTLDLGAQRGAEELAHHLNLVYDALIAELHRFGGSAVAFSGDAITCWFDGDDGMRATAAALSMQQAMQAFATVVLASGKTAALAVKAAVATGPVHRFLVGEPRIQVIDVLCGQTLDQLADAEHQASRGEVVLSASALASLDGRVEITELRADEVTNARVGVVSRLLHPVSERPWPPVPPSAIGEERYRDWLLPAVYRRLKAGQGDFLAELRPVVSFFLRFSGIDYDEDPQAGVKLDAFVRKVQHLLARYEGTLLSIIIGDKGSYLQGTLGAPQAHEDDVLRAVSATHELQALSAELDHIDGISVGLTHGRVRTGAYGSRLQRTYGMQGDIVNLAARLMQAAAPGEILASEPVQAASDDAFAWERLSLLKVKGKADPVTVFRLIGPRNHRAVHLSEPRFALPIVGREAERNLVRQKVDRVLHGQGQVIGIVAEAGMGKSRFVAEIVRMAADRFPMAYAGECVSFGMRSSYLAWQNIWRAFFGLDASRPLEEQVAVLEQGLAAIEPSLVPRLPLLGLALNLHIPDNDLTRSMDAKLRKSSLEALLVDCLRARSVKAPLLIVLEDCHWMDPLSADLAVAVSRSAGDLPMLLVFSYRPPSGFRGGDTGLSHLLHSLPGLPQFTEIQLGDLEAAEAEQLIALKAGTAIPQPLAAQVIAQAQGNPFYIEELLNYLQERGISGAGDASKIEWPASLHSLILSRIDQLSEHQKTTLKVASVIGRVFRASWLWGYYPELGEPARITRDLEVLRRLDLTPQDQPEPEPVYLFRHVVTQEVAYESLLSQTRATLHELLGLFIERAYADTLEQYVDLLAYHYGCSKNAAKQREYLRRAGQAAEAAYANAAAIDYYERLLPLLPDLEQGEIILRLGQVLELVGRWEEAGERYTQALRLAERCGDWAGQAQSRRKLGWLLRKQGEYAAAARQLAEAHAAFAEAGDQAGMIQALADLGEVHRVQGDYATAQEHYAQSLALAEAATSSPGNQAARAHALKGAGTLAAQQGDYPRARALYEASLAIRRDLGDRPGVAVLLNNLSVIARFQGDFAAARTLNAESLVLFREMGDLWSLGQALNNLGVLASDVGDHAEACALLDESLAVRRRLGDKWGIANSLSSLGHALLGAGEYTQAQELMKESLAVNLELGDRIYIAYLLEDFAWLAAAQNQPRRAQRLAGAASALREAIGAPLPPAEQAVLARTLEPARQALGTAAAAVAWESGRALSLEEAAEYAVGNHIVTDQYQET